MFVSMNIWFKNLKFEKYWNIDNTKNDRILVTCTATSQNILSAYDAFVWPLLKKTQLNYLFGSL